MRFAVLQNEGTSVKSTPEIFLDGADASRSAVGFRMDLIKGLVEKVKPELNHIYTEPPFLTQRGRDLGWFCREHALHLYGLAKLLGKDAEICVGDFMLRRPKGDSFHSIGDADDHAWCCIDELAPVDLSLTVKHIYRDLPDVSLIYGDRADLSAPFHVRYFVDEPDDAFCQLGEADDLLIGYNEKKRLRYDLLDLLANPFEFLHRPPPGMPTFPELYGDHVFFAVTYHCYRLLTEDIKNLCRYRDHKQTVRGIMKFNSDAKQRIEQLIA